MFLERCGQMLSRPFFYLLVLAPWVFVLCIFFLQRAQTEEMEARFGQATLHGKGALERKLRKEKFLSQFGNADPYFLDRSIESMVFLAREKEQLEFLLNHPALPQKEAVQARLSFLSGSENRLSFREENVRTSSHIKETEEKQRHPVQLDASDLEMLLSRIEHRSIGNHEPLDKTPQLLVRDLKLKRITTPLQTEVFELELELLNREFLK